LEYDLSIPEDGGTLTTIGGHSSQFSSRQFVINDASGNKITGEPNVDIINVSGLTGPFHVVFTGTYAAPDTDVKPNYLGEHDLWI
jgi:hypothetical protein